MSKHTFFLLICLAPFTIASGILSTVVKGTLKTATIATGTLSLVALSHTANAAITDEPATTLFKKNLKNVFNQAYNGAKVAALHASIFASQTYNQIYKSPINAEGVIFPIPTPAANEDGSENISGL